MEEDLLHTPVNAAGVKATGDNDAAPAIALPSGLTDHDSYGALVGWTHREMAGKFDLRLQTKQAVGHLAENADENFHIIMTRQQATLLANYLFQITDQARPRPRRGRLARWLGT